MFQNKVNRLIQNNKKTGQELTLHTLKIGILYMEELQLQAGDLDVEMYLNKIPLYEVKASLSQEIFHYVHC